MNRLFRFLIAAASAFILSCIILGAAYLTGLLAGGHMYTFELSIKLSPLFAAILGVIAAIYPSPQVSRNDSALVGVAAFGAAIGCLYWYSSGRVMAMRFTGHWQWGFLSPDYELQAVCCWVAAGASAMMVAVIRRSPTVLLTAVVLCVLAVVLPAPVFNSLTNNQELTVAFATPASTGASATQPLQVIAGSKEFDAEKVRAHVLETLRTSGLQGEFRVNSLYRTGSGKKSLQIVVVSAPVAGRALLPQPNGAELIYVQKAEGWERIPPQAPTLSRSIEIWGPGSRKDSVAYFGIMDAAGLSLVGRLQSN